MNIRVEAALILSRVIPCAGTTVSAQIDDCLDKAFQRVPLQDQRLLQEMVYGVCRRFLELEHTAHQLLKKPLRKKDNDVFFLMLVGLYQLTYMRIPDHAAVSETVSGGNSLKKSWAKGLLNGVLRNAQRQKQAALDKAGQDDQDSPPAPFQHTNPSLQYSHPAWLVEQLQQQWPEQWRSILEQNNVHPPFVLRANQSKTTTPDYLTLLADSDIPASAGQYCPDTIYLESPCAVDKLPRFDQGYASVQDEAAQLCCSLLQLEDGNRVLDACAAPGGKTSHLLEHPERNIELLALDLSAKRLERVTENFARLDLQQKGGPTTIKAANASELSSWWDQKQFDRILVDAPCSATGVIRRHPDIRWHRQPKDVAALAELQLQLLSALWQTLAPGGLLLYATCSILKTENVDVISQFVNSQSDVEHQALEISVGQLQQYGRQLLPTENGPDGFYFARLKKSQS
ncbi:MAG: 16S rRNA (cytosine(967)-C(5))-methyltransferase [Gammaproteobacteria bacterium]|nr:MAG: 16S rRNA (cytosine(967)-C(5))-methyltransferase [Gammaproteobacteria bacterium]